MQTKESGGISKILVDIIGQLKQLSSESESKFLLVGNNLKRLVSLANRITEISNATTISLSGSSITSSIDKLQATLDKIIDYTFLSETETGTAKTKLNNILTKISEVDRSISSLTSELKALKMLGMSARIESSFISGSHADFNTIADQVDELSHLIKEKSTNILGKGRALTLSIRQALKKVSVFETERSSHAQDMLGETRSRLASLSSTHDNCSTTTTFISEASQEVSRDIEEIVQSVQFHDIARQQIEHVSHALNNLSEALAFEEVNENLTEIAGTNRTKLVTEVRDVCISQAQELLEAERKLNQASMYISGSLQDICVNVNDILLKTKGLAGAADVAGKTFFAKFELGLGVVKESLSMTDRSKQDLFSVMRFLLGAVEKMSVFAYDIEDIVSEVELIAVNAQIKAAGIGIRGATLGVVAKSIKEMSIAVSAEITTVPSALEKIGTAAQELKTVFDSELSEEKRSSKVTEISKDLSLLVETVREANSGLVVNLTKLDDLFCILVDEISETVAEMSIDQEATEVFSTSVSRLDEIAREAEKIVGFQEVPAATNVKNAEVPKTIKDLVSTAGTHIDQGENVEFF